MTGPQAERVSTLPASRLPQTIFLADLTLRFYSLYSAPFPALLPQFSLEPHKSFLTWLLIPEETVCQSQKGRGGRETGFGVNHSKTNTWVRVQMPETRVHCQNSSHSPLSKARGFPASLEVHPWIFFPLPFYPFNPMSSWC